MVIGMGLMTIELILVGLLIKLNLNTEVLVVMLIFIVTFQFSMGGLWFTYCSETVIDGGIGLCIFAVKFGSFVMSLTTEYMMDSAL